MITEQVDRLSLTPNNTMTTTITTRTRYSASVRGRYLGCYAESSDGWEGCLGNGLLPLAEGGDETTSSRAPPAGDRGESS